ncbi:MAG: DUF1156 domain-containing protein [Spirochaetales bacterium]|nr:DUF1156 domain-containing protein [Spirochaetales bacterium]
MSDYTIKSPKKLIEVALPLDDINEASAREKSIRHGHPSTLHLWWARRPLASARAVIFAQMVNDPLWRFEMDGTTPTPQEKAAATKKREKLFAIIRDLVKWENTTNEEILEKARAEIRNSWKETCELNKNHPQAAELFNPDKLPAFHDPFAGGGSLPLEAQRLGLESYASDLNPVPVMINKAMIEIPPLFANCRPVHPIDEKNAWVEEKREYKGAQGLAEDVAYYGKWMRDEAEKKIGHLYPKVKITKEMVNERPDLNQYLGNELTVIAYIWARTVKSPNPAFNDIDVPLSSSFVLSKKKDKEAWIEPVVNGKKYTFKVHTGKYPKEAENGTKSGGRGAEFTCIVSNTSITGDYIKNEGQKEKIGAVLLAAVCEGNNGRVYISPNYVRLPNISEYKYSWKPEGKIPARLTGGTCVPYGFDEWYKIFTPRQLTTLNTFSELIPAVINKIQEDAVKAGLEKNNTPIEKHGIGALAYSQAISVYLCFLIDQVVCHSSTACGWNAPNAQMRNTFGRQAIPMVWDFAEVNVFSNSSGSYNNLYERMVEAFDALGRETKGSVFQSDAQTQTISQNKVVSTDPPYYDNIAYADLSDFFYVWIRHNLRTIFPSLFTTIATPKEEELVASAYRHNGKENAEQFFLKGMTSVMANLANITNQTFPVTIYYAFKQSELENNATSSTGWETFLQAVINAGFSISGTWPMRTEKEGRMIGNGANALASSIVLVCRRRSENAEEISRREFLRELKKTMDSAKEVMTQGDETTSPVAPVDLSQAIIGPGMAVFSKYKAVLEADGSAMSVKEALKLINRYMEEDDYDANTLFCKDWYNQNSWEQGLYGEADVLARAKNANLQLLQANGTIKSGQGKVQLTQWKNYEDSENILVNPTLSTWNLLHQCIHELNAHGTQGAATVYARYQNRTADIRSLAYTMYTLCERSDRAEDARAYNELIIAWDDIEAASSTVVVNNQPGLFD